MAQKIDKKCLEVLYSIHSKSQGRVYSELRDRVIDDVLMNRIRNGRLSGITPFVDETIRYFYDCANELYRYVRFKEGCKYIVYRGTKTNYLVGNIAVQPIPFSASLEEKNTDFWVGKECCRWHIQFPLDTRFVGIDNPKEGKEIILPAGILYLQHAVKDQNGIINYYCQFNATKTYEEMKDLQKKYNFA